MGAELIETVEIEIDRHLEDPLSPAASNDRGQGRMDGVGRSHRPERCGRFAHKILIEVDSRMLSHWVIICSHYASVYAFEVTDRPGDRYFPSVERL